MDLIIADLIDGSDADATLEGYSGARIHLTPDGPYGIVDLGDGRWAVCRLAVVPVGPGFGTRADAEEYAADLRDDVQAERARYERAEKARRARQSFTVIDNEDNQ